MASTPNNVIPFKTVATTTKKKPKTTKFFQPVIRWDNNIIVPIKKLRAAMIRAFLFMGCIIFIGFIVLKKWFVFYSVVDLVVFGSLIDKN